MGDKELCAAGRVVAGSLRHGRWLTKREEDLIDAMADRIEALVALVDRLHGQFDHAGCTCTFPDDSCCAYADAALLLKDHNA